MINQEIEAYLQQLKAMGMTDDMIAAYRQQYEESMQAVSQVQEQMAGIDTPGQINDLLDTLGINMTNQITLAENTNLTPGQQWGVACGADLAYLSDYSLNTLETFEEKEYVRQQLSEWWDVDGGDELKEMIAYLKEQGHRRQFAHVDTALRMSSTAEAKAYLKENLEDFETAMEWFHNMRNAYEQFAEDGLLPEKPAMPNLIAWDYARIINLCRNGFDAKYMNKPEALAIIAEAAKTLQQSYSSWRELSISYQFGRYVWGGEEEYEILKEGMEDLLDAENSPWVCLDWNTKL